MKYILISLISILLAGCSALQEEVRKTPEYYAEVAYNRMIDDINERIKLIPGYDYTMLNKHEHKYTKHCYND